MIKSIICHPKCTLACSMLTDTARALYLLRIATSPLVNSKVTSYPLTADCFVIAELYLLQGLFSTWREKKRKNFVQLIDKMTEMRSTQDHHAQLSKPQHTTNASCRLGSTKSDDLPFYRSSCSISRARSLLPSSSSLACLHVCFVILVHNLQTQAMFGNFEERRSKSAKYPPTKILWYLRRPLWIRGNA